jgi:hypothetical protein
MGANDYNSDFGCTPMEYRQQIDSLMGALGLIDSPSDLPGCDVIRLATQFIYDAQQRPSRREIAAMAMQGLLARPEEGRQFPIHINVAEAIAYADELINQLSKNPIAEGLNLLPVHSRELDEGAKDDN